MQFYQRLRDMREDADKSQAEISQVLEVSQQHYSMYESGKRELPMHHFITLARFYDVSLDFLAGLTDTPRTLSGAPYRVNKSIKVGNVRGNGNKFEIH